MAGLGPTGFVTKRLTEIVKDAEDAARAAFGPGAVTQPDGAVGIFIGLIAAPLAQLWELGQSLWSAFSPSTAEGVLLDSLVELNNIRRLEADETEVWCRFDGDDAASIAAGTSARHPDSDDLYESTAIVQIRGTFMLRQDIRITANDAGAWGVDIDSTIYSTAGGVSAQATVDALAAVINRTPADLPISGVSQAARRFTLNASAGNVAAEFPDVYPLLVFGSTGNDAVYTVRSATFDALTGQTSIVVEEDIPSTVADGNVRKGLTASTVNVADVDDDSTDVVAANTLRLRVYMPADATDASRYAVDSVLNAAPGAGAWAFTSVGTPGLMRAAETGPKQINASVDLGLVTGATGLDGIVSVLAGDTGRDEETDAELRLRRLDSLQQGGGTVDAIRAALLAVEGVDAAMVYENDTDLTDADGRPPHSVHAVVEGGVAADIAQAIYEQKAAGIATFGDQSAEVDDTMGIPHTIEFDRVTALREFVVVHARSTYDADSIEDDAEDVIADAIAAAGNQLAIGQDVAAQRFFGTVFGASGGLADLSILVRRANLDAFDLDESDAANDYLYLIAALGNLTGTFPANTRFSVRANTSGLNGVYTVVSALFTGGRTRLTVTADTVPATVAIGADGAVYVITGGATGRDLDESSAATNVLALAAAAGDLRQHFVPGVTFTVEGNTNGLDGCYTVSTVAFAAGRTLITTREDVPVTVGAGASGTVFVAIEVDPVDADERATFDTDDITVVVP